MEIEKSIEIENIQVAMKDLEGVFTWDEAMEEVKKLGEGWWRLPTKEELNLMYLHKDKIGGFVEGYYWSSTEYGAYLAWVQDFSNGDQYYYSKDGTDTYVRAVRSIKPKTEAIMENTKIEKAKNQLQEMIDLLYSRSDIKLPEGHHDKLLKIEADLNNLISDNNNAMKSETEPQFTPITGNICEGLVNQQLIEIKSLKERMENKESLIDSLRTISEDRGKEITRLAKQVNKLTRDLEYANSSTTTERISLGVDDIKVFSTTEYFNGSMSVNLDVSAVGKLHLLEIGFKSLLLDSIKKVEND